jgi:hypothetical protein
VKFFDKALGLLFGAIFFSIVSDVFPLPSTMYFDPSIIHSEKGVERFVEPVNGRHFTFKLSPFHQHASGARNRDGKKVPLGDRAGRWEMLGILFGSSAAPESKPLFPSVSVSNMPSTDQVLAARVNYPNFVNWLWGYDQNESPVQPRNYPTYLDSEQSDDGSTDVSGDYSVWANYEKNGIRGEFSFLMGSGFGITIKCGAVDYKHTPSFFENKSPDLSATWSVMDSYLSNTVMSFYTRKYILDEELGLNTERYSAVALEDVLAKIYWSKNCEFKDAYGELVVNVSPYFSFGLWLPSGKMKNVDKFFSLPTGNDGFCGASIEGALSFDFPGKANINLGGGITFFQTKTLSGQRVPSHRWQRTIYPWKATIQKRPGASWNINASLVAREIVEDLSAYFDFVYSKHEQDSIKMKEGSASRNALFYPDILEKESLWVDQSVSLGFDYKITPDLAFGLCLQGHISGRRVFRNSTVMGSLAFSF